MFNPEDFEEYFEEMNNNEDFKAYFSDDFDKISEKGIGWYLTTISDEQLKTLLIGAREFIEGVSQQIKSHEETLEREHITEISKHTPFNIFINVAVNCIAKEAKGKDFDILVLLKMLKTFYMVIQFETAVRDKIIDTSPEQEGQYMFVTNIEETFIDFEINDKGKRIANENIVNSLCMN